MSEEFEMEEGGKGPSFASEAYDWVESALNALLTVILIFVFLVRTIGVVGSSMYPTLKDSDILLCSRIGYTAQYGDIVVVTKPNIQNEPLIKRVIATGGQVVEIDFDEGIVKVDGIVLDEPYINEPTYYPGDLAYPLTVPEGHVFVMGDNRNASWDSRASAVGMVDERYILGRAIYRVMPYDQMGVPYTPRPNSEG